MSESKCFQSDAEYQMQQGSIQRKLREEAPAHVVERKRRKKKKRRRASSWRVLREERIGGESPPFLNGSLDSLSHTRQVSRRFRTKTRYDTVYTSNQGHAQIYTHEYALPIYFVYLGVAIYHSNETIGVKFPRAEVSQTLLTSGTPRNTCNRAETNPYSTRPPTPRAPNRYSRVHT